MKNLLNLTKEEKTLQKIIINELNEYVGGFENEAMNCEEDECEDIWPLQLRTKQNVCDYIYYQITRTDSKFIRSGNLVIERKHIKFMGNEFIKQLIEATVEFDYLTNGWHFKNNFYGGLN